MIRKLLLTAFAAVALPSMAAAGTVDVAGNFGSPLFQYGYGTGGGGFTAFGTTGLCVGTAGTSCKYVPQGSAFGFDLPAIGLGTTGSTVNFYTNQLDPGVLFLQPGSAPTGQDVILRFIAPATALYTLSGSFQRIDTTNNGDGVNVSLALNNAPLFSQYLTNQTSFAPVGGTLPLTLTQGDVLSFVVNNNGDFGYDGTGLKATITSTALPEPATWGMMILGFGVLGALLRRRRQGKLATA